MIRTQVYQLHDLLPYVNWLYFFHAWGMAPRFAGIADVHDCRACRQAWISNQPDADRAEAQETENLHRAAITLIRQLDGTYEVKGRFGLFPAWSEGDDIVVLCSSSNEDIEASHTLRLPFLRQQGVKKEGNPNFCLSDFIAPREKEYYKQYLSDIQRSDELPRGAALGIFATAVDAEMEHLFPEDDYKRMLVQTMADRMAEAAAEKLHEDVRRYIWGYAPNENFSPKSLFAERYEGKRPAVGYPSMPDQSINFILDELIQMETIGIELTENGMMVPHAAVSGLMLDHPAARHFSVGRIGTDQLQDYAQRRGMSVDECKKFLSANL